MEQPMPAGRQQAEIYTYESPHLVYSMNWSVSGPRPRAAGGGADLWITRARDAR
jgi:hypothetical protein